MRLTVGDISVEDWTPGRDESPNFVLSSISDSTVPNYLVKAKSIHNEKPVTFLIDPVDALTDELYLHVGLGRRGEHCSKITGEVCANVRELLGQTDGKKDRFSYPIRGPDQEAMGLLNFYCEWKLLDPNDPTLKHTAVISAMDPTHIHPGAYVLPPTPPPKPELPAGRPGLLKSFGTRIGFAFAVDSIKDGVDSIMDDLDHVFE